MAKIPFTLGVWLKDKNQKVETRDGRIVHNIWRVKEPLYTNNKKAEVCALIDGEEDALVFFEGGRYLPTTQDTDSPFDLFIVTPEPELSEFEEKVKQLIGSYPCANKENKGSLLYEVQKAAAELLELARKELEPEVLERLEIAYKNQDEVVYENGKREGKAEALKDLPRWIDDGLPMGSGAIDISGLCGFDFIRRNGKLLRISTIEKLPGFNE